MGTIYGTAGDDLGLSGSGDQDDIVYGGAAGSNQTAFNGHDSLFGLGGSETLYGGGGDDSLDGGDGDDILFGGKGDDSLDGGAGQDTLYDGEALGSSSSENDRLIGGTESDRLYTFGGSDTLNGGAGLDTAVIDRSKARTGLVFKLDSTTGTTKLSGDGTTVINVETFEITGGTGSDSFRTGSGNDRLDGGAGNDSLSGGDGHDLLIDGNGSWGTDNDRLDGGAGDDVLRSVKGVDTLLGGAGDDTAVIDRSTATKDLSFHINGVGNTTIYGDGTIVRDVEHIRISGGSGRDWFRTSFGKDELSGGAGNDWLRAEAGDDKLDGGAGDDSLDGGDGNDELDGGAGNDSLDGDDGNDELNGADGNDWLEGGVGRDVLFGGAGNDTLFDETSWITPFDSFENASDKLSGGDGSDKLYSLGGTDVLNGGAGRDVAHINRRDATAALTFTMTSANSTTTLVGDGTTVIYVENIRLTGGSGNDRFTAGSGNDALRGGNGNDVLDGGSGNDYLFDSAEYSNSSFQNDDILIGGTGNDGILSRGGRDTIDGGAGNDQAEIGRAGADEALTFHMTSTTEVTTLVGDGTTVVNVENIKLNGGRYDDHFTTSFGDDELDGGGGSDVLDGGAGDDILTDNFFGSRLVGNDRLSGGSGEDVLISRDGQDVIDGGAGQDSAQIYRVAAKAALTFTMTGTKSVTTLVGDGTTVVNVETIKLYGGSGADHFTTSSGDDELHGGEGNDILIGGGGDDWLIGDNGDDILDGGSGNDRLVGGWGVATVQFTSLHDDGDGLGVRVDLAAGRATSQTTSALGELVEEIDTLYYFDNVIGSFFDDELLGDRFDNALDGAAGSDVINGASGADLIDGASGDDIVDGGAGADQLTGGEGADAFVFSAFLGRANADRIVDFSTGEDTIQLSKSVFAVLSAGTLPAAAFKDVTTGAVDASDRILYDQTTGVLSYDADGSGATRAVQFAVLDNKAALTATDFFVV